MDSLIKKRLFTLVGTCCFGIASQLWCASHSESMGTLSFTIAAGSVDAPSFSVFSTGLKRSTIYRGTVKSVSDNNVTFYRTPNIANPGKLLGPFTPGVLSSDSAKAVAELDENGSISAINLIDSGSGYLDRPKVYIRPPTEERSGLSTFRSATAEAIFDSNTSQITGITVTEKGRGYANPPTITVDGGPHFITIIDPDSNFSGLHYAIVSNSDHVLELNNSTDGNHSSDLPSVSEVFTQGLLVEVVKGWTLGSLFGYSGEELLLHHDINSSRADWVYLLREPKYQTGDSSDYVPHFHNGTEWKSVDSPEESTAQLVIAPDQSIIISRRADSNTSLLINGTVSQSSASWYLPEYNRTNLVSNPYPTELKISDLISNYWITEDNSSNEQNASLWLANEEQDLADNVQILNSSGWSTYWHDGTNLNITEHAKISARAGSGLGGALTQADFSMVNGQITSISNPLSGNAVVTTSSNHQLSNGFLVTISDAFGRLTNENKEQIGADGNVVDSGEGLLIESPVNGRWEITNVTDNTFELKDCQNHADYINDGSSTWSTGSRGQGYDANITLELTISGGGGFGARATGKVGTDGKISSIKIIHGGLFYTSPPTITVHSGGWRKLGRGNAPINELTIPPGSGVLLVRKHPFGVGYRMTLRSFLHQ